MKVNYVMGTKDDYEDIIDFANYVFSEAHNPHDFKKILPKLYADENRSDGVYHYLCKEDDKIKAMVMLQKTDIRVGAYTIKSGGIGTVSSHPYSRGKGYMKKLMNDSVNEIRESCDIGILGGQRQRYNYFGFEKAGTELIFSVNEANIKHTYKNVCTKDVELKVVSSEDKELIKSIRELISSVPLIGVRSGTDEQFFNIMLSWKSEVWALLINGEFKGYLVRGKRGYIAEIYLSDSNFLPKFIKAFLQKHDMKAFDFTLNETQRDLIPMFFSLCEGVKKSYQYSYLLANPQKVLEAFLNLKLSYANLSEGSVNIAIEGKTYKITIAGKKATVSICEDKPIISFNELEAINNLLSPHGNLMGELDTLPDFAKAWFPLPLYVASPDGC